MSGEVETMAYYGETPWHGLGIEVLGAMTAAEAIAAAGLDWDVELVPVYSKLNGGYSEIDGQHAIRRVTDRSVFGVVGKYYTPIQNRNAFKFFDDVVGTGGAMYHTAGSLRGGSRVWMLAKLPEPMDIQGDEVEKYLVLSNSHDGNLALQMFWTPIRVVCMNTLSAAMARTKDKNGKRVMEGFYTRHTKNIRTRVDRAAEILGLATKYYEDFAEQCQWLATHQLPAPQMPLLLKAAFGQDESIKMEDIYSPIRAQMERVEELITVGKGNDNPRISGTKWQAYNAVAEFADHERTLQARTERADAVWFGSSAQLKERAWNFLLPKIVGLG